MYKDYIKMEVDRTMYHMMSSRSVKESDFMNMLISASRALKCSEGCVVSCASYQYTLE